VYLTKLLVISDSHGEVIKLEGLFNKLRGRYDRLVHLGDRAYDMASFQSEAPDTIQIKGNMELDMPHTQGTDIYERLFEAENIRILATHGHRFSVHYTLSFLKKEARNQNVRMVLYGHTHRRDSTEEHGIMYFNPGAFKDGSYGLVTIDKSDIVSAEHFSI
jgi:uncharacterized protein